MPVAIPLIGLAVSAGMGGLQMAKANKEKKNAKKAIDDYQRQDLVNPYGALAVSTLGADRMREDLARTLASYGNQVSMGGSRSIAASLPNLLEQQNNQEAQIAANLDQEQSRIDQMKAQGQYGVMNMQEQRENADLAGLGTQLDLANSNAANARNSFASGIANGLTGVASAGLTSMNNGTGFFGQTKPAVISSPTSVNSIAEMKSGYNLKQPIFNNNNIDYAFGNNINGFAYSNPSLPILPPFKSLR